MKRDQLHDLILYEVLPTGPSAGFFADDNAMDILFYRNRSLYVSNGDIDDSLLLIDLILDVPDLSRFSDFDAVQKSYYAAVSRWIYAWLLIDPETMNNAILIRIDEPENWRNILDICAIVMHDYCLGWIQHISDSSSDRHPSSADIKQQIMRVLERVKNELKHPDNAEYDEEQKKLLLFYSSY